MLTAHGLWTKTAPSAPQTTALEGAVSTDVLVVGAGFTGLSAALHLAESGVAVTVIEAADVGSGGSGRNVGLVNAGMWIHPNDLVQTLGSLHGERLIDCLGNGPRVVFDLVAKHGMVCEAMDQGTLHCAVGDAGLDDLKKRAEQWQARGAAVRLLSREETIQRVGSEAYSGSLLDLRAGTIQPMAYVRGLAKAALGAGAQIFTQSPALTVTREGKAWAVTTPKGVVTASWVIVATNAYSTGPWSILRRETSHLPYFNFATQPLNEVQRAKVLPGGEGAWNTRDILTSFRMDAEGRLVIGSVGALRGTGKGIHRAWARRELAHLFPDLAKVPFESEWYGWIGVTDTHLPYFHRLGPQMISFGGYSGRGISPGTVFGRMLAAHVLGDLPENALPLPVTEPRAAAYRVGKELVYDWGAQAAHLVGNRL
jgi:sarcosine oxidase